MLAVIVKRNPLGNGFKPGTWVECFDDGCRKVIVEQKNNRLHIVREEGIIISLSELAPFIMRPKKQGLDK